MPYMQPYMQLQSKLNANRELNYHNGRKGVGCITEKSKQSSLLPAVFLVNRSLFHYSLQNIKPIYCQQKQKMTISLFCLHFWWVRVTAVTDKHIAFCVISFVFHVFEQ